MSGVRTYTNLVICAGLCSFGVFAYACSSSKPAPAPKPAQELWGELGLPPIALKQPWHGYPLGDWIDRWDTWAARAVAFKGVLLEDIPVTGVRMYNYFDDGSRNTVGALDCTRFIVLSDPRTGHALAIVDEHLVYQVRSTAAATIPLKWVGPVSAKVRSGPAASRASASTDGERPAAIAVNRVRSAASRWRTSVHRRSQRLSAADSGRLASGARSRRGASPSQSAAT